MSANGNGVPVSDVGFRTCPTRISPAPPVIAHRIAVGTCQQRQRDFYHKCWTCALAHRAGGPNAMRAALVGNGHGNGNGYANGHANGLNGHSNGAR